MVSTPFMLSHLGPISLIFYPYPSFSSIISSGRKGFMYRHDQQESGRPTPRHKFPKWRGIGIGPDSVFVNCSVTSPKLMV